MLGCQGPPLWALVRWPIPAADTATHAPLTITPGQAPTVTLAAISTRAQALPLPSACKEVLLLPSAQARIAQAWRQ